MVHDAISPRAVRSTWHVLETPHTWTCDDGGPSPCTGFLGGQRYRFQHHARRRCVCLRDRDHTRVACVTAHRRALRALTRATPIRCPRARGSACRRARLP